MGCLCGKSQRSPEEEPLAKGTGTRSTNENELNRQIPSEEQNHVANNQESRPNNVSRPQKLPVSSKQSEDVGTPKNKQGEVGTTREETNNMEVQITPAQSKTVRLLTNNCSNRRAGR